jgi:hypothetical protein
MKARVTFVIVMALALGLGLILGLSQPQPAQAQALGGIIALPILRGAGAAASSTQVVIQVQNVGNIPTRAALFLYGGYSGFCEPQAPGAQKVECSGLIYPGSAWIWTGSMLPTWAQSGVIKAVAGCPGVISPFVVASDNVPLAIDVTRSVPGNVNPTVFATSSYGGILGEALGSFDPIFGGFTYFAPTVRVNSQGFSSIIYVQNAGTSCTSAEIWLRSQDDCLRAQICEIPALAPGEVYPFDLATCVGGSFSGSVWIRTSQPAGILVDTFGFDTRASYSGVPGLVAASSQVAVAGSQVNYGPLIFREFQGWETRIDVQNLSAVIPAVVKVYFLDQSGDIITTLVDWVCPRGSQTFFLPVINNLPGQYVGSVRVESQAQIGFGGAAPPNIVSVANLTKYEGPARAQVLETLSYNLLTEPEVFDWQVGPGHGGLIGVPSLLKGKMGLSSEIAINNVNPNPGFTDYAILLFDQNGLLDYVCQKLNEKQVEYIQLQNWGYVNPGFAGSAVISATYTNQDGGFGLAAVVVERSGPIVGGDMPGDESNGQTAIPIAGTFDLTNLDGFQPPIPVCPGQPGCSHDPVSITGFVTDSVTKRPLADVTIMLSNGAQTTSGILGGYTLTDVPSGQTYTLTATKTGYQTLITNVAVPCNQNRIFLFSMQALRTIEGTVWYDNKTENDEIDPNEGRLVGVPVTLVISDTEEIVAQTLTDSQGHYEFVNVPADAYRVSVTLEDTPGNFLSYESETFVLTQDIVADFDATDHEWFFRGNIEGTNIEGIVWDDNNEDERVGLAEPREADIEVDLLISTTLEMTTTTSALGSFSFADLAPGDYYLRVGATTSGVVHVGPGRVREADFDYEHQLWWRRPAE